MKTVWILKGLPASGKSTWARNKVISSNCSIKRVNKDDLRVMLDKKKWSKNNEKFILEIRDYIVIESLSQGKHIIVDDTNLHPKHEEQLRLICTDYTRNTGCAVRIKIKFFDVSPEDCVIRDLKRSNSVGSKVIWDMYNDFLKPEKVETILVQDTYLPHACIIDLDGTLAILNNRNPYDASLCGNDELNEPVAQLIRNNNSQVFFFTGREDKFINQTISFLRKHGLWDNVKYSLSMRKTGDYRKDYIIKNEMFNRNIKNKYYIDFVVDDRPQVIRMWKKLGLFVFSVGDRAEF